MHKSPRWTLSLILSVIAAPMPLKNKLHECNIQNRTKCVKCIIYIFILICTGEKVEPWSSFTSRKSTAFGHPSGSSFLKSLTHDQLPSVRQHFRHKCERTRDAEAGHAMHTGLWFTFLQNNPPKKLSLIHENYVHFLQQSSLTPSPDMSWCLQ